MATYTEQDKVALLAMVTRYNAQQVENERLVKEKQEIEQRLAEGRAQIQRFLAAFAAFGFDTTAPGKDENRISGFQLIRNLVGSKAYLEAFAAGGRDPSKTITRDEDGDLSAAQEIRRPPVILAEPTDDKSIRDLTLAELKLSAASGTTATAIRERIERMRGTQLHYKTIGMTLYRLTKEGLARREGRIWFFVPPNAETKNPAGETAGSVTS